MRGVRSLSGIAGPGASLAQAGGGAVQDYFELAAPDTLLSQNPTADGSYSANPRDVTSDADYLYFSDQQRVFRYSRSTWTNAGSFSVSANQAEGFSITPEGQFVRGAEGRAVYLHSSPVSATGPYIGAFPIAGNLKGLAFHDGDILVLTQATTNAATISRYEWTGSAIGSFKEAISFTVYSNVRGLTEHNGILATTSDYNSGNYWYFLDASSSTFLGAHQHTFSTNNTGGFLEDGTFANLTRPGGNAPTVIELVGTSGAIVLASSLSFEGFKYFCKRAVIP